MCWLCEAKHISYKRWGPNDRKAGLDEAKFVERVQNMRKELCPFWEWPELIPSYLCLPDWLHAVDQGIGADIAGQILVELADQLPARAFKGRVALLWEEIKGLYKELDVEYRLANLTPGVLNKEKKTNKTATLKGLAAQIRHFIPLLPILTAKYFSDGNDHQQAVNKLARFMADAYQCMETNDMFTEVAAREPLPCYPFGLN